MRKSAAKKRELLPDSRYNDPMVTQFVNNMMWSGKKSTSFRIFYDAIDTVAEQTKEDGYEVWKKALANIMPSVEVKSKRIGGSTFQIPVEVRPAKRIVIGMAWMISFARKRSGRSMAAKLAAEIQAAYKNEGAAVKKRDDTHRMAEANKAFSHFRA